MKIRNKCIYSICSYIKKSWEKAVRINKKWQAEGISEKFILQCLKKKKGEGAEVHMELKREKKILIITTFY